MPVKQQPTFQPAVSISNAPAVLVLESDDDEQLIYVPETDAEDLPPPAKKARLSEDKFRIQANKVALTYACPVSCDDNPIESKEELLDKLLAIIEDRELELNGYVIGEEKHDNEKRHFHVQLDFATKIDIKNSRFFDVKGVHPKIEKAGNAWVTYCVKGGLYLLDNITIPAAKDAAKQAAKMAWEVAIGMAEDGKVNDAMAHLRKFQPKEYLAKSEQYRKTLNDIWGSARIFKRPAKVYTTRWLDIVESIDPLAVEEDEDVPRTLIFAGPQGIGKTEAAKYVLQKAGFKKVLIVNQTEDLKKLHDYDAFVYDECNVNAPDGNRGPWEREAQIMLVDWAEDRSIKARYSDIMIPRMTPRILTTNNVARCINFTAEGVNRRVKILNFDKKMFE